MANVADVTKGVEANNIQITTIAPQKTPLNPEKEAELLREIKETTEAQTALDEYWQSLELTDDQRQGLYALIEEKEQGLISEEEFRSRCSGKLQDLPDKYFEAQRLEIRLDLLKDEHIPYKREETKQAVQNLAKRLNYRKALFYFERNIKPEDGPYANSKSAEMRQSCDIFLTLRSYETQIVTTGLENKSYEELEYIIENFVQRFEREWEEAGFLEPLDDSPYQFSIDVKDPMMFKETVQNTVDLFNEFDALKRAFRVHYGGTFSDIFLSILQTETEDNHNKDPKFMRAIADSANRRMMKLSEIGLIPMSRDVLSSRSKFESQEAAIDQVRIEGLEDIDDKELSITETELREILATSVPAIFLRKINLVIAKNPPPKPEPQTDEDSKWETIGQHIEDMDQFGNLKSSQIEIYRSPYVEIGAPLIDKIMGYQIIWSTALHEAAHSIHYELSMEDMEEWLEIMRNDPVYVSAYVERTRKTNPYHFIIEDFAESYQMLFCSPLSLRTKSPQRFKYMLDLLERYMPQSQFIVAKDNIQRTIDFETFLNQIPMPKEGESNE